MSEATPTTLADPTGLDFYLRCSGDDTSTCHGGHVGTSDDKGNFTATVVTSDSIRAGQNSANVDQNGVEVTTGGKSYSGQYFDNPASHTTDANGNDVNHNPVDLGNLSKLDAPSNAGGLNSGDALAREALDAYYSLSMGEKAADLAAAGLYPGLYRPTENYNNLNPSGTAITSSSYYQGISDGRGGERVGIQFITPIPGIDADPRFNSLEWRNEAAHDAGSRVTGVTFEPKQ